MLTAVPESSKMKFLEIKNHFTRMSNEMCAVIESYYIWAALTFARSIPEVGEEKANKNAALMAQHNYFFMPTEQAHLKAFVIGLMKFFDNDPNALSIYALIREVRINKEALTADVFRSLEPKLAEIGAISDGYSPFDPTIQSEVKQLRKKHKDLIKNLEDIRNKQFAHTEMKPIKDTTFVPNEVAALIEGIQDILNKLTSSFNSSHTLYDHPKNDSTNHVAFLLDNLEKGVAQRKEEHRKMYDLN